MPEPREDDPLFLSLVISLQQAAYAQMGKIVNPASGRVDRDLHQAKVTIDMLVMLQRKTEGNRSEDEDRYIRASLSQLQLNYIDEVNKPAEPQAAPAEPPAPDKEPT